MVLFSEGMSSRTVLSARFEKSLMKIPACSKDILISGALYAIAERDFISPLSCFTAAFYDHVWFCTNAPGRLETIKPGRADGYRCFIRGTNGDFPFEGSTPEYLFFVNADFLNGRDHSTTVRLHLSCLCPCQLGPTVERSGFFFALQFLGEGNCCI